MQLPENIDGFNIAVNDIFGSNDRLAVEAYHQGIVFVFYRTKRFINLILFFCPNFINRIAFRTFAGVIPNTILYFSIER